MSIFTSLVSQVIEVPGGGQITIRKLAPKHLDEARKAAQHRAFTEMQRTRELLSEEFLERVMAEAKPATVESRDPLLAYDRLVLMSHGVTAWTFDQAIGAQAFEDLDDDTADWLAGAILRLAKPSLYQTEDEQEQARKNG